MESKLLKVFQVHKAVFLKFVFLSLPFCYISDSLIQIIKEKRNKEKERVGKERNVEQFLTFGASGIGGPSFLKPTVMIMNRNQCKL